MKIAVDAMGGDFAPTQIVQGAALAAQELGVEVALVGPPSQVKPLLANYPQLEFVPAEQVVGMDEHPASAVRSKPDSSMAVCARLVKEGEAAGWVSAGNSGAVMTSALLIQGRVRGVERPALGSIIPTLEKPCFFLDVGANVDCRPEYLLQFARMGSLFSSQVMGREAPRVGLLANAEEDGKGSQLLKTVNQSLHQADSEINFIGNVEPQKVIHGGVDVVVADGLLGNVAIKMGEAVVEMILTYLKREVPRTITGKLGGALISSAVRRIRSQLDWREYGGAPLLGINGVAVVAHGRSDSRALRNAIRVAMQTSEVGLHRSIDAALGTEERV